MITLTFTTREQYLAVLRYISYGWVKFVGFHGSMEDDLNG